MNQEGLAAGIEAAEVRDFEGKLLRPVEGRVAQELTDESNGACVCRVKCRDRVLGNVFQRRLGETGDKVGEAEFEVDDVLERAGDGFAAADVRGQREDG